MTSTVLTSASIGRRHRLPADVQIGLNNPNNRAQLAGAYNFCGKKSTNEDKPFIHTPPTFWTGISGHSDNASMSSTNRIEVPSNNRSLSESKQSKQPKLVY